MMIGTLTQHFCPTLWAPLFLTGGTPKMRNLFITFRADTCPPCTHIVPAFYSHIRSSIVSISSFNGCIVNRNICMLIWRLKILPIAFHLLKYNP